MHYRDLFKSALAALPLLAATAVHALDADAYPARPIKLIVHTTPGSSSDETARVIADAMGRRLGQTMVVENRAGAGGAIGAEVVANAPADGYTLLAGASSVMVTAPAMSRKKLSYDPDSDFVPIGRVSLVPYLLVVNPKSGFRTMSELVAAAKAKPGKITYATAGTGTNNHLLGELLSAATGTSLVHVPYKGPAPAQVDLLGGIVDMQFDTQSTTEQLIRTGRLNALATSGSHRPPSLPTIPTFAELGYTQMQLQGWNAMYAPRGTPPAVVKKLQAALTATLDSPEVRAKLASMGQEPDGLIGDELLREQRRSRDVLIRFASSRNIALD